MQNTSDSIVWNNSSSSSSNNRVCDKFEVSNVHIVEILTTTLLLLITQKDDLLENVVSVLTSIYMDLHYHAVQKSHASVA